MAQGRLEKFYEDAFGTPQSKGELYTGFFLLIAGIALTVIGVILWITQANDSTLSSYNWRETGGVIASLGVPAILIGIAIALPSKWHMRVLEGVGVLFCLVGTVTFMVLYPYKWNTGTGDEVWGVLFFLGGLAMLLASTITSLIGYYVARATGGFGPAGRDVNVPEYNYDIPDSVIEKDIELAMRRYNVTWGGEGTSGPASSINFDVKDDFETGAKVGGRGIARSVTLDAPQVDVATEKLRGIRSKGSSSMPTAEVDSQTAALLKFRQQKAQQEAAKASRRPNWFIRLLRRLFGGGPKPTPTRSPTAGGMPPVKAATPTKAPPPHSK